MLKINNKGQSLVMFVLIIPIFLLILTLVYDVGNAIYEKDRLSNTNYLTIEYGLNNWVDFIPTEAGKYEIDIRVKDEFSSRKCDASTSLVIEAKSYVAADIDYILLNSELDYFQRIQNLYNILIQNKIQNIKITSINNNISKENILENNIYLFHEFNKPIKKIKTSFFS